MIHMNPDYALQYGAYYFACLWLIGWGGLIILSGIFALIEKIKEKHKK